MSSVVIGRTVPFRFRSALRTYAGDPMTERRGTSDSSTDHGAYPGTPRWVYLFGIVVAVLVLVFLAVHLAGGGLGGHWSHR